MSFTDDIDALVESSKNGLLSKALRWERRRLGDFADILNGYAFPSSQFSDMSGTPLIRIRDLNRGETQTYFQGAYDQKYLVRPGEILVGMDGDFNCVIWTGRPGLLNQRVCKITPHDGEFDRRLLSYLLPGYLKAINAKTSAITVKHLSSKTLDVLPLPCPPMDQQIGLVQAIESYLSRLDNATENLKALQAKLKQYRASVLKAAVEGRLVPTEAELARKEGRAYEPASVLLERILKERKQRWIEDAAEKGRAKAEEKAKKADKAWTAEDDAKALESERVKAAKKYKEPVAPDTEGLPELPEGWCWATVDQLAFVQGGLTKGKKRKPTDDIRLVPYLRVANVQRMYLDLSEMKSIEATSDEIEQLRLQPGDVLFNEGGDRDKLGRGWVWKDEIDDCIHQNHVFRARPIRNGVVSEYLSYYGNTAGRDYFFGHASQSVNLASINMTMLKALPIALPPSMEQRRAVSAIEKEASVIDSVEETVDSSVRRVSMLRQAVLRSAFAGNLASND